VGDFLAFDDAVGAALDFAKKDGRTLVMAFPDHNTGGLTLGNYHQLQTKSVMPSPRQLWKMLLIH
jgi:alkaline phosphatase